MKSAIVLGLALALAGCDAPGRPGKDSQPVRPDQVISFTTLYATNCAGCHGAEGRGGAAQSLRDPVYRAIADDAAIRNVVRNGVRGTPMPAFARSAGGMLTDQQIDAIVDGMRNRWGRPKAVPDAPPYVAHDGNAKRGAAVHAFYCASCHGADGRGGTRASSIVDGSFLALTSNQSLRTTVIVGRPELGAPDFRENVPGQPMTAEDVSDVVAWLVAQRPQVAGQPYPAVQTAAGETR
jgi:cytochrome c oxidase cbb3-type subunit III